MKVIEGFGGRYMATEDGRIYSRQYRGRSTGRFMGLYVGKCGYCEVTLHSNGQKKTYKIHRLIATTFIPNPLGLPQVNHIDGVKTNNHVSNLEWVDRVGNMQHALSLGLLDGRSNGEKNGCSKLTESEVLEIRQLYKTGTPVTSLLNTYPVSQSNIYLILNGQTWGHLPT